MDFYKNIFILRNIKFVVSEEIDTTYILNKKGKENARNNKINAFILSKNPSYIPQIKYNNSKYNYQEYNNNRIS